MLFPVGTPERLFKPSLTAAGQGAMDHPPPTHGHGQPFGAVAGYVPAGYMGAWRVAYADCQGGHVHFSMRL